MTPGRKRNVHEKLSQKTKIESIEIGRIDPIEIGRIDPIEIGRIDPRSWGIDTGWSKGLPHWKCETQPRVSFFFFFTGRSLYINLPVWVKKYKQIR